MGTESRRRIGGIVCLCVAVLMLVCAGVAVSRGPDFSDPSGEGPNYAAKVFFPGFVTLLVGLLFLMWPRRAGPL